jgi:hypothetical protein
VRLRLFGLAVKAMAMVKLQHLVMVMVTVWAPVRVTG